MTAHLTREQVRRVDQLAIEQYGMIGLVLMENAGRNAAAIINETYSDVGRARLFCGVGNNGGDGFVIARHLHNAGWSTHLVLAGEASRMTPDTKTNHDIALAMDLPIELAPDEESQRTSVASVEANEIVVDALLGTGFRGDVRELTAGLINGINGVKRRALVAIDLPSGLDCDSGQPSNATIRADLTITFVAFKTGFRSEAAIPYVGRVEVADIGAPRELLETDTSQR